MKRKKTFSQEELRYLKLLARQYPTVQAASSEIINLQAILNLPKGTEHFISDLHGEYEAFLHILNSCSGVIREKVDDLYAATISKADRDELCHPHLLPGGQAGAAPRRHMRIWTSGTASPSTGSLRSAGW